jgi:hypothetical protein
MVCSVAFCLHDCYFDHCLSVRLFGCVLLFVRCNVCCYAVCGLLVIDTFVVCLFVTGCFCLFGERCVTCCSFDTILAVCSASSDTVPRNHCV